MCKFLTFVKIVEFIWTKIETKLFVCEKELF